MPCPIDKYRYIGIDISIYRDIWSTILSCHDPQKTRFSFTHHAMSCYGRTRHATPCHHIGPVQSYQRSPTGSSTPSHHGLPRFICSMPPSQKQPAPARRPRRHVINDPAKFKPTRRSFLGLAGRGQEETLMCMSLTRSLEDSASPKGCS